MILDRLHLLLIVAVVFASSAESAEQPLFAATLIGEIKNITADHMRISEDDDLIGLQMATAPVEPAGASIIPLAKLWKLGQLQTVELAWWKQTDRVARVWILAMFYSQMRMDVSGAPDFEAASLRFDRSESADRREELKYVIANLDVLSKLVTPLLSSTAKSEKK